MNFQIFSQWDLRYPHNGSGFSTDAALTIEGGGTTRTLPSQQREAQGHYGDATLTIEEGPNTDAALKIEGAQTETLPSTEGLNVDASLTTQGVPRAQLRGHPDNKGGFQHGHCRSPHHRRESQRDATLTKRRGFDADAAFTTEGGLRGATYARKEGPCRDPRRKKKEGKKYLVCSGEFCLV